MLGEIRAGLLQSDLARELALLLVHWPYWVPVLLVALTAGGWFGRGFGAPSLFRDDEQLFEPDRCWGGPLVAKPRPPRFDRVPDRLWRAGASPALWGAFGFMAAFGLFWIAAHAPPIADPGARSEAGYCFAARAAAPCPTEIFRPGASGGAYLVLALAAAAAAFLLVTLRALARPGADFRRPSAERRTEELLRAGAGLLMGALFALFAYGLGLLAFASHGRGAALLFAALPYLGMIVLVAVRPNALPVVSIASVVVTVILIGIPLSRLGGAAAPLGAAAVFALVVFANGGYARRRLPGFETLYDDPINPQARPPIDAPPPAFPAPGLVAPEAALAAWADRGDRPDPSEKPLLVLLATSGGAYRAAFWTGFLIDHLVAESAPGGRWPGLADSVRLVTGASGGMVGGAYFAALAANGALDKGVVASISTDTRARMGAKEGCDRNQPIARDSLSPVVHQLLRRDLPSLFLPRRPAADRGHVLDAQWATLAGSFASLAEAERAGRAPSLVISPMLVETGAVALFANLDLDHLRRTAIDADTPRAAPNKASVEVFKAFAPAHERLAIATAVRLSATFPYVSPAISLPTRPDRRPVDAGYYDNYGIDLLTAYLEQDAVLKFASERCRGVAVIQIRAFPSGRMTREATRRQRAFHFLTSPVEGIFAARQSSQMFRNDQQLALARRRYAEVTGDPGFLRVFTFEANTDVSLSWYLRCDEMRALDALVKPPRRSELVWDDVPPSVPEGDEEVGRAEVEAWVKRRFDPSGADPDQTPEAFVRALQARDPEALWAQHLHHRAKVAEEFHELARFWTEQPAPRRPSRPER